MSIDAARLQEDLETLAGFGRTEGGGVSRPSFSPADLEARSWLKGRCAEAGLAYREDVAGNVFMRLEGPSGPAVWTGSHLDSVPNGGRLDGALGVMAGLEVLRSLAEHDVELTRPVEAVSFADEEGAYLGFLGSKAAVPGLAPDELAAVEGRDGRSLADAMSEAGYDLGTIGDARVDPDEVHAYVELHIEQGAVLQQAGIPVGVVTHIVGVGRGTLTFEGRPDHAGTTPMDLRRDATRGGAALLAQLPELPSAVGADDAVVTCGRLSVEPGADNIVPARMILHLDIRDRERASIEAVEQELMRRARALAEQHDLEVVYERTSMTEPTPLDERIQDTSLEVARQEGLDVRVMPSGAGHDAQVVATAIPTGMLFVPSIDGRSHSPLEHTPWEDIGRGTRVLYGVVRDLATRGLP
jgi:beta-ureidopropionase / N-carbamoyl-L-amino-acid hydrolase